MANDTAISRILSGGCNRSIWNRLHCIHETVATKLLHEFRLLIGAIAPWLGLQMFVTDRARNRYRFLADRGVGTVAYYWSRTLPAAIVF